jgi:Restriction endonuclease BglII
MVDRLRRHGFEIAHYAHAEAILRSDFPEALREIEHVLKDVAIPIAEIVGSGGGEAANTQRMRRAFSGAGWKKTTFEIEKIVNRKRRSSVSHEIDHVKNWDGAGTLALEIEWNNKDPFFDRDLENFQRLHADGAISAGILITRGSSLQASLRDFVLRFARDRQIVSFADLTPFNVNPTARQRRGVEERVKRGAQFAEVWSAAFVGDKFGESTTHWRKLQDRVQRGVGNPCPLLLIGLPAEIITF